MSDKEAEVSDAESNVTGNGGVVEAGGEEGEAAAPTNSETLEGVQPDAQEAIGGEVDTDALVEELYVPEAVDDGGGGGGGGEEGAVRNEEDEKEDGGVLDTPDEGALQEEAVGDQTEQEYVEGDEERVETQDQADVQGGEEEEEEEAGGGGGDDNYEAASEEMEEPVMPEWMAQLAETEEGFESMSEGQRAEYDAFLEAKAAYEEWANATVAAMEPVKAEEVPQDNQEKEGNGADEDDEDDDEDDVVTKESQREWLLAKFMKKVKFREDVTPEGAKKTKYKYSKPNWKAMASADTDEGWDGVLFNEKGFIQTLALPGCFIKEDVKKMKLLFTEHLEVLDLSENSLKGSMEKAFGNLRGLKSGEPNLDACKGLLSVNLSGNKKLKGFVCEALGKAKKLEEVTLSRTGLQGSIAEMSECKDLKVVNVGNTKVSGKLADLGDMVNLTHVMVDYSQINGDIDAVKNWPNLNTLYANGKMVTGDMKVFGEFTPKLSELWLTKSNVYGTLEFAKSCPELTLLDIYGTQIGGEIKLLEDCPILREIYMNYCFVNGDICALEKNPMLTRVLLDYTYVSGDIKVFEGREELFELGLAYTSTTGDLRSFHGCYGLRFLNIYGVRGFEEFDGPATDQILNLPLVGTKLKLKKSKPIGILKKKLGKWTKITV